MTAATLARGLLMGAAVVGFFGATASEARAECSFTRTASAMVLRASCTTDETILIPNGVTLDGQNRTITAVDPAGGSFDGAIVKNAGERARVRKLKLRTQDLNNTCDGGDDRLRGILFDGASGSIDDVTVLSLNQGPSGCQEGSAIEIRNEPFDGTHPNTQNVVISDTTVRNWQKGGIIMNGDVRVRVENVNVGESATQENLSANGVQFALGAIGLLKNSTVAGNQNLIPGGADQSTGTGILIFQAQDTRILNNRIVGNAGYGILATQSPGTVIRSNVLRENTPDGGDVDYDVGIYIDDESIATNNVIRCYDDPVVAVDPAVARRNVVQPCGIEEEEDEEDPS